MEERRKGQERVLEIRKDRGKEDSRGKERRAEETEKQMKGERGRKREEMSDQAIGNAIREWRESHLELVLFRIHLRPFISAHMKLPSVKQRTVYFTAAAEVSLLSPRFLSFPPPAGPVLCADNCFSLITTALR